MRSPHMDRTATNTQFNAIGSPMDRDDLSSAHMHAVLVSTHNCCEWMGSPMDREAFMMSPQMDTMEPEQKAML